MTIIPSIPYEPMVGDPDDHRPNTTWALVVDPEAASGNHVRDLTLLFERIAVGDRIPLHSHPIDEAIIVDDGQGEVTLGDIVSVVGKGAVVFVPAGVRHGTRNLGDDVLAIHAVFGSPQIGITYFDRNPAPGTEGDAPQPPMTFNARNG